MESYLPHSTHVLSHADLLIGRESDCSKLEGTNSPMLSSCTRTIEGGDRKREQNMKNRAEEEAKETEEMTQQSCEQSDGCSSSVMGKTVVVGLRMDAQSRELLTWSLVKVAEPGDRVVALHILVDGRSDRGRNYGSSSSLISLLNSFESVLSVYEGFCNLKQIDLKLKVSRGSSLRKALVREIRNLPAASLILGVAKSNRALGSSTSVARYCARKLPRECAVMAVSNGKVVYQRETAPSFLCLSPSDWISRHRHLPHVLYRTASGDSKSSTESEKNEMNEPCLSSEASPISIPSSAAGIRKPKKGRTLSLPCNIDKYETYNSSFESSSPHRDVGLSASQTEEDSVSEKFTISTFQRALRLPNRQSPSPATVHPDRQPLQIHKDLETLHLKYSSTCKLFSFQEISAATLSFSSDRLIGKGGSSRVYKAILQNGDQFAAKILKQSEAALKQFLLEVEIITALHHKNIISLSGLCFEDDNLALVYNFISRGSLEDNLHGNKRGEASFGWAKRLKVAIGVAEALNYLHSGRKSVIHRDVKSSNILLADDYQPLLADFGLAQFEGSSSSSSPEACSDVAGTFGYLAPEYFMYGKVDEKTDVYAFGVVLLELLTGKQPINAVSPKRRQSLVTWAKEFLVNNRARLLLDPSFGDEYDECEVERAILAASLCIRKAPILRPRMALVLRLLQGDEDIVKWAELQVRSYEEEGETNPSATIRSHLSLALLDVEDEISSSSSADRAVDFILAHGSLQDYFQSRGDR